MDIAILSVLTFLTGTIVAMFVYMTTRFDGLSTTLEAKIDKVESKVDTIDARLTSRIDRLLELHFGHEHAT